MDFKLGYNQIVELGQKIDEALSSAGIRNKCNLTIPLETANFKKVDEDLYYRGGNTGDYVPANNEIIARFNNVNITIMLNQENKQAEA